MNVFLRKKSAAAGLLLLLALAFWTLGGGSGGLEVGSHGKGRGNWSCGPDRDLVPAAPPMRGPDVRELQERLKYLGLYSGPINGIYDRDTVRGVITLQQRRGMSADGRVRPETWWLMATPGGLRAGTEAEAPDPDAKIRLEIDLHAQRLTVFVNDRPHKSYPVAIGKPSTPSPPGEWKVVEKEWEPGGDYGARWLGIDVPWGGYGIHGTNRPWSIGTMASLGCIRMSNADVAELYEWVREGTMVVIRGNLPDYLWGNYSNGSVGLGVVSIQLRLRQWGFSAGRADGMYGDDTSDAVSRLQMFYGLPVDGVAGPSELYILDLREPPGDLTVIGPPGRRRTVEEGIFLGGIH